MSTIKTNRIQVGQDANTQNNYTIYQPAVADGTIRIGQGNPESVTDRLVITGDGNIGIGASAPTSIFEVYSATAANMDVRGDSSTNITAHRSSTDANGPNFVLRKSRGTSATRTAVANGDIMGTLVFSAYGGTNRRNIATITGIVDTYTSDTSIGSYLTFSTTPNGSITPAERMRIDHDGEVGIGTQSLGYPLAVQTNVTGGAIRVVTNSANVGTLEFTDPTQSATYSYVQSSNTALVFGVGITPRMRITSAGNVGIGTDSPSHKLDVQGSGSVYVRARSLDTTGGTIGYVGAEFAGGSALQMRAGLGYTYLVSTGASDPLLFGTNSTERMRLTSGGNLGIATSTVVNARLSLGSLISNKVFALYDDGTNQYGMGIAGSQYRLFGATGANICFGNYARGTDTFTETVRIDGNGDVGIGVTDPTSKLHVKNGSNAIEVYPSGTWAAQVYNANDAPGSNGLVVGNRWAGPASTAFEVGSLYGFGAGSWSSYMKVDGAGNVGIGTAAPEARFEIFGPVNTTFSPNVFNTIIRGNSSATSGSAGAGITFKGYTTGSTTISDLAFISGIKENTTDGNYAGALVFGTRVNGSGGGSFERVRIDSNGDFLVGATGFGSAATNGFRSTSGGKVAIGTTSDGVLTVAYNGTAGSYTLVGFYKGATVTGSIISDGTTTTYQTSSDVRMKHDIVDADDAGELIDKLKVRSFKWNVDNSEQRYGFVAQELVDVAPEAVGVPNDTEQMWGVDYAKLVPMMIKEIQSLRARLAKVEGK